MVARWGTWVLCALLLACGNQGGGGSPAQGGSGGQVSQGGSGLGGGGLAASSGGTGGDGGAAGGAGMAGGTFPLPPQPACTYPAAPCAGECVGFGESKNGCTFVAWDGASVYFAALGGDLYYAGGFMQPALMDGPPLGLHRLVGATLERTELDTMEGHHVVSMALAGDTLFYFVDTSADDPVRSVPIVGGTPAVLTSGLRAHLVGSPGFAVRDNRVYVASTLAGDGQFERVRWFAKTGGALTDTDLTMAGRMRVNATQLVASWSGNIDLAPFPDGTPTTTLLKPGALDRDNWWIDDTHVYWLTPEGAYKRLRLDTQNATEELGELIQMLPTGMVVIADTAGELLLALRNDTATGLFTMPLAGGKLTQVAVVGKTGAVDPAALDTSYVWVVVGGALFRIKR